MSAASQPVNLSVANSTALGNVDRPSLCSCFFTLQRVDGISSARSFRDFIYISEVVRDSLNPSWRSVDFRDERFGDFRGDKRFVLQIWSIGSALHGTSGGGSSVLGDSKNDEATDVILSPSGSPISDDSGTSSKYDHSAARDLREPDGEGEDASLPPATTNSLPSRMQSDCSEDMRLAGSDDDEEDEIGADTDRLLYDIEDEIAKEQRRAAQAIEVTEGASLLTAGEIGSALHSRRVPAADLVPLFGLRAEHAPYVDVRLVLSAHIDLAELSYLPPHSPALPDDAIMLELVDGWYIVPQRALAGGAQTSAAPGQLASALESTPANSDFAEFISPAVRFKRPVQATKNEFVSVLRIEQQLREAQAKSLDLRRRIEGIVSGQQSEAHTLTEPPSAPQDVQKAQLLQKIHAARLRSARLKLALQDADIAQRAARKRLEGERDALLPRLRSVSQAQVALVASRSMLHEDAEELQRNEERLAVVKRRVLQRRWQLVHGLRAVYPITQPPKDSKHLQIARLSLPNSEYTGCEEEHVATALGFVCHCVLLCSRYLDVPLRYPMLAMGSRSVIQDTLSVFGVQQKFPLYSRGVERNRFDYAVFLLNKNIEQLLNSQGLELITLRHTLPNLQILLSHAPPESLDVSRA